MAFEKNLMWILHLNLTCFALSLLQVFLVPLVQLVSKQLQINYMNAWCFALPPVPPFTIHPWTYGQVFISDFNLPTKDHSVIVAEPFLGKKNK